MGFFFFNKKTKTDEEYLNIIKFNNEIDKLLNLDKYIARSDYTKLISNYEAEYIYFCNIIKAGLLKNYCKQNNVKIKEIENFIEIYDSIKNIHKDSKIIEEHNNRFINNHLKLEREYLDNILKKVDPIIDLDEEQRKVILTDEDYSLVIAGAGAGKTTTVAAKVKYLVERKNINPKDILVISFTNKAVSELREKINNDLKIDCPVSTFHSIGYTILREKSEDRKRIINDGFLYYTINEYLKNNALKSPEIAEKIINFFATYFDMPYEGEDINAFFNVVSTKDFSTLKGNVGEYNKEIIDRRTKKRQSINNEIVRSIEEVRIANFLYLNGIDYEYEPIYPYHILKAKKPYTPDFKITQNNKCIYIEHFGITESGTNNLYKEEELNKYKIEIKDKINLHKKHNTKLIYTFSKFNDGRDILDHLKEDLISNGIELKRIDNVEVFKKLINSEENKYITKFVKLLCTFIHNFKTRGCNIDDFSLFQRKANVRSKLFLEIAKECYLEYQNALSKESAIDFEDMINESSRILKEKILLHEKLNYKYVIVDEYQDISRQRFNLTKALSDLCEAKIIAVGDDWQSIYAFSGSDVTLFTEFSKNFGYAKELKITKTYRNAQEIIDIAGNFIQKNSSQIKKSLISPKSIYKPVIINTYSDKIDSKEKYIGGKYYYLGKTIEKQIGYIIDRNQKENKSMLSPILLIGRYNFDARNMCFSKDFVYDEKNNKVFSKKYPKVKLEFLTAHSSKGLGYDNVIIINARNELYGFPSKVEDDPVLNYVVTTDNSIEYAEERRLFYVALTRTKNRVYIACAENNPSEFILELLRDYPNVTLVGDINKNSIKSTNNIIRCPLCGYPLQYRFKKNYGMKLWLCTNEPEICNFITNNLKGNKMSIQKCDECRDGYLVIKEKDNSFFLGCSNYKSDGTGCNRTIALENYNNFINNNYELDSSINKPIYNRIEVKDYIPQMVENSFKNVVKRESPKVNLIKTKIEQIQDEGFDIITDDEGNIITDITLLKRLREKRAILAKESNVPAYVIMNNNALVNLATYHPISKEEFISLYGLGEKKYEKYGEIFIKEIMKFYAKNEKSNK